MGTFWRCTSCGREHELPSLRRAHPAASKTIKQSRGLQVIRIAEPRIGEKERQAVLDVLASGRLTAGPYTRRLEEAFARDVSGTAEAVAVSSGTAALHLALLAHDIGPGDEVITSPFSFQATANMVLATGARPVFVDVGPDGNIDASLVEAAITPRTKALLPVHLYGRLCDMPALCAIAARHSLALIEDAAQAHGAAMAQVSPGRRCDCGRPFSGVRGAPGFDARRGAGPRRRHGAGPAAGDATSGAPSAGSGVLPASMPDAAQAHGAAMAQVSAAGDATSGAPSAGSGVLPASMPDAAQAHGAAMAQVSAAGDATSGAPSAGSGVPPVSTPDAVQTHAAAIDTRLAGSFGTGCFSLYATKNLTAGEGGVVTTNDSALAQRLRRLRSHGEADRYESIEVGYNYRITEVGAALAFTQLEGLLDANRRRRENAAFLSQHLLGVGTPPAPSDPASHVWHQYTVRVAAGRDDLQRHLRERGIEAMVYYPKTLPAQKLYRDLGYDDAAFPMARRLANEVLVVTGAPGPQPRRPPDHRRGRERMDGGPCAEQSNLEVTDDLRIGVIGLGFGANHARILSQMPGVCLAAVADTEHRAPEAFRVAGRPHLRRLCGHDCCRTPRRGRGRRARGPPRRGRLCCHPGGLRCAGRETSGALAC